MNQPHTFWRLLRSVVGGAVMLAGLSASARGSGPTTTAPGLSRVAPRCSVELDAPCWSAIAPLRRFAASTSLHLPAAAADVRLAWDDDGLLVRVDALPEGGRVELGLAHKEGDTRLAHAEPLRVDAPGVHRLSPARPLESGSIRRVWVNVVVPDGAGWANLPWAPAGPATPDHPARVLFAEASGVGLPVELERSADLWSWRAVGGDEVRLTWLRPALPRNSRGVPAPWTVHGTGSVQTPPPPEWGMVEALAVWRDAQGVPVDLVAHRVWSEPPGPTGVSASAPFFPPPKTLTFDGGTTKLPDAPVICRPDALAQVAELLVRELHRVTGAQAVVGNARCDIVLAVDASQADAWRTEGFSLVIDRSGISLTSAHTLGATYGALALVDAFGPDGTAPRLQATDWPTVAERPLYHSINLANRPDLTVDDYITFIERVVPRGRYDQLHLYLADGIESPGAPGLARPNAWTAADIARIRAVCAGLGIELVPGVNAPGHTGWMLRSHPELAEDVSSVLVDVRHPDLRGLLDAHYTDVWQAFGEPDQLHIGHDETMWVTSRSFVDEWGPRSSTTPRSLLFAEDLRWHLEWCTQRGITPYIWSDMLLEGWHGGRDGVYRALDHLTPAERQSLRAMAWSPLGDPLTELTDKYGIPVLRVHTAYVDWKRDGLSDAVDRIAGEGLAVFVPAPWAAFAPATGSRNLHYHLGSIILAGASGWEPALEAQARIRPTLAALAGHPVLRPGYRHIAHRRTRPLVRDGARPTPELPDVAWPRALSSDGRDYTVDPHVASPDAPLRWSLSTARSVAGVSVLVAAVPTHAALMALRQSIIQSADPADQAVGWLVAEHTDGSQTRRALEYGEDIYHLVSDPRANAQWRSADVVPVASPLVAALEATGRDRRLYRVELAIPDNAPPVQSVRLEAPRDGIPLVVGAASLLLP